MDSDKSLLLLIIILLVCLSGLLVGVIIMLHNIHWGMKLQTCDGQISRMDLRKNFLSEYGYQHADAFESLSDTEIVNDYNKRRCSNITEDNSNNITEKDNSIIGWIDRCGRDITYCY